MLAVQVTFGPLGEEAPDATFTREGPGPVTFFAGIENAAFGSGLFVSDFLSNCRSFWIPMAPFSSPLPFPENGHAPRGLTPDPMDIKHHLRDSSMAPRPHYHIFVRLFPCSAISFHKNVAGDAYRRHRPCICHGVGSNVQPHRHPGAQQPQVVKEPMTTRAFWSSRSLSAPRIQYLVTIHLTQRERDGTPVSVSSSFSDHFTHLIG